MLSFSAVLDGGLLLVVVGGCGVVAGLIIGVSWLDLGCSASQSCVVLCWMMCVVWCFGVVVDVSCLWG